jgi:NAD kinase
MRVLVIVNPGASRAESVAEELSRWFAARAIATFVSAGSIEELKQAIDAHGASADRIVIGGGDGTISGAVRIALTWARSTGGHSSMSRASGWRQRSRKSNPGS